MSDEFIVNAELRADQGKGASRRLRRLENKVPAIIYGVNGKDPVALSLKSNEIKKSLSNEAFYSHILTVNYDGKSESAILKDLQRHPATNEVTHADFLRVAKGQPIHINVPLHFINQESCVGVKRDGGAISHSMTDVEIVCLPKDLPEYLEVDMKDVAIDTVVHLSDIVLPKGVEIVQLQHGPDHDLPVASIHLPKGASSSEDTAEEDAEEDKE